MNNENEFNISPNNSFKKQKAQRSGSFGKSVFLPFVSGILGASLVVGTCFGVPSIKNKLLGEKIITTPTVTTSTTDSSTNFISISDYSNTSIAVAEKVLPSVVGIKVKYQISSIFGSSTSEASGSGIILSEDGYIVTNNHVISSESSSSYYAIEEATGITVSIYGDKQTYNATVVGTDSYTDLAVIKIDATGLTPAELGDSSNVKVGEFAMAIGNPAGMDYSVTSGIISAINREITVDGSTYTAIQTDAAINSGNSGGALVNADGQVIGINTLKLAGSDIEGIGFAIPISSTTNIIEQLIQYNSVKRPYIGIGGSSVGATTAQRYNLPEGVYVEVIDKDSPAEKSNLKVGDIITKINGNEVTSVNELNKYKNQNNIGDTITLTVYRDNKETEVLVVLEETPETTENSNNEQQNYNNYNYNTPNNGSNFNSGSIFDLFR